MALVPHKVVALNELNEGDKNTISGAVVSLFDTEGNAVTLFDDESGANGSTAKQTDSEGVVVVYVTPGEYDEQVNGGIQRRVLVGNKEITTEQLIERIRKARDGDVITTTGFTTAGDAGGAQWKATSTTGLTPSQTPADRGAAELVDGSGRLWELVYTGILLAESIIDSTSPTTVKLSLVAAANQSINDGGRLVEVKGDYVISGEGGVLHDVIFIGGGSISGVYRLKVHNEINPALDFKDLYKSNLANFHAQSSPVVTFWGDSLMTYAANSLGRQNTLAQMLKDKIKKDNPDKTPIFFNRAIGGQSWETALTPVGSTEPWYTDDLVPWIDYVESTAPDLLIISFGMNGVGTFEASQVNSVIDAVKSWAKIPDIVLCTNLIPTINPDPNFSAFATEFNQEGRDMVASYVRNKARYEGFGLIDINRSCNIVRDGFDCRNLSLVSRVKDLTLSSRSSYTYSDNEVYGFKFVGRIIGNESEISDMINNVHGNGLIGCNIGRDQSGANVVLFREGATGNWRLDFFNNGESWLRVDTSVPIPTSTFDFTIELYDGRFMFRTTESTTQDNIVDVDAGLINGARFIPKFGYQLNGFADGPFSVIDFDEAVPAYNRPLLTNREIWGEPSASSDTKYPFGGNGANHLTSLGAARIYYPVVSNCDFSE